IAFCAVCIFTIGRWSRRLIWIYNNVKPQSMRLLITINSDSDRTGYYAVFSGAQAEIEEPLWKVAIYNPRWDVKNLTERQGSAEVYCDPKSLKPAGLETDYGFVLSVGGRGGRGQVG